MAIIIVLLILAYSLFYSGLSQFSTGGNGVNFFESLGFTPGAILTAVTIGPPPEQQLTVQPATASFLTQSQALYPPSPNTAQVA